MINDTGIIWVYSKLNVLQTIPCSNRRNSSRADLLTDKSSYLQRNKNGEILLKKVHHFGYYAHVKMFMGLSQINYCDFVVFTFKCMIIRRVEFHNEFYKIFMLPGILLQRQIKMKTSIWMLEAVSLLQKS